MMNNINMQKIKQAVFVMGTVSATSLITNGLLGGRTIAMIHLPKMSMAGAASMGLSVPIAVLVVCVADKYLTPKIFQKNPGFEDLTFLAIGLGATVACPYFMGATLVQSVVLTLPGLFLNVYLNQ